VLATGDPALLSALGEYQKYYQFDMKTRHRLEQVLGRGGGAGGGGRKCARTEAELRAEMEKNKKGVQHLARAL
jgi:hypothetical protein